MSIIPTVHEDTMLLLTLRDVSELVSHSHDLVETLRNIVHHIQTRFATDVCSVYLVDPQSQDLVLRATVGLRPEAVDQIRMPCSVGLTGLVAERKTPVSVEDAPSHARYRYFPDSGEEEYRSFLGVPLIQAGDVQGVLVVQHRNRRIYSANEVRLLLGVAAQIAILVTNARLTQHLSEVVRRESEYPTALPHEVTRPSQLEGQRVSPGFGLGRALVFEEFDFSNPTLVERAAGTIREEKERLAEALEKGRRDIDRAAINLANLLGDQFGALMQAQRLMLEDSALQADLNRLIDDGASVEQALVNVFGKYLKAFQKLDNPFFYERIYDIKDVFRRVLGHVLQTSTVSHPDEPLIVVAHEVSLMELFACDLERVQGIVVATGGGYSHVAILARSLSIPMLTQVPAVLDAVREGDELFVDAHAGLLYINPQGAAREACLKLRDEDQRRSQEEAVSGPMAMRVEATVNLLPEISRTVRCGGEAVGLYRSEFLELARRSFPTEEEQLAVYRKMVSMLAGRPLTIRTLDLRAEKLFGVGAGTIEEKQQWEWRLVDELPHVQDLLRGQLRAALRVSTSGPIRILFPMISSDRQWRCALGLLKEARQSLKEEGLEFRPDVPIGIMVEVPAAAMMIGRWVRDTDFVCIGSNDLLHSLLGIERNDDTLEKLKTPLDPNFLKTIRHIVHASHASGKSVTVCGEAGSKPFAAAAMAALGVDAVSVPPDDLPRIRRLLVRLGPIEDARGIRRRLARCRDAEDVECVLREAFPALEG